MKQLGGHAIRAVYGKIDPLKKEHSFRLVTSFLHYSLGTVTSAISAKFTWSEKLRYIGEYKEGEPNGQGTLIFHDGSKWIGQWIDGKEWETKHFSENGTIIGKFSNGKYFK